MRISDWSSDVCSSDLFIDKKGLYHGRVARVDHRLGTCDRGDHAAAVDVAHQYHRHVGRAGKAHVCDVPFTQVDFGWAASALDYNDISGCAQAAIGGKDGIQKFRSEEHTSELQSLMRHSYAVFCLKK